MELGGSGGPFAAAIGGQVNISIDETWEQPTYGGTISIGPSSTPGEGHSYINYTHVTPWVEIKNPLAR